jgi:hypothetical protein
MQVSDFKTVQAGALRGVFDLTLPSGLVLRGCGLFAKDGRTWAAPPSRQMVGRDGTVLRNADGKARYEACVSFVDRAPADRWSASVIEAVRASHPETLA